MTYNVICYPTGVTHPEATVVAQSDTYRGALGDLVEYAEEPLAHAWGDPPTIELKPLVAQHVAALTPYGALQAWELIKNDEKVALLAIQLDIDEEEVSDEGNGDH